MSRTTSSLLTLLVLSSTPAAAQMEGFLYSCSIWYAECSASYRVSVGMIREKHDTTFFRYAWMSNCDPDNAPWFAGTVPASNSLTFYVPRVLMQDRTTNSVAYLEYQLEVGEYANTACSGGTVHLGIDVGHWLSPIGVADQFCWADGQRACGAPSDPTTCHLPDISLARPTGTGTQQRCYKLEIFLRKCTTSPGSGCTSWFATSRDIKIDWL